jgi:hypothetical protein
MRVLRPLGIVTLLVLVLPVITFARGAPAPRSASGPSCNRPQARIAASRSPLGDTMRHELGSPLDPNTWSLAHFSCSHLQNLTEIDMVAEFECCTANSPTPIGIFRPGGNGRWRLTYSWSGEPPVYSLALHDRTLEGRTPVYNGGPLCCPVGSRPWSVRWNGRRWIIEASYNEGRPSESLPHDQLFGRRSGRVPDETAIYAAS